MDVIIEMMHNLNMSIAHQIEQRLAERQINRRYIVPLHLWSDINLNLSQRIDEWRRVCLQRIRTMLKVGFWEAQT